MSLLSDFAGGGAKFRYQEFTASGTFTPSAKLLANGGQVMLDLRGGGGGGAVSDVGKGGNSKHVAPYTVSGATTVTIGAGGAANATGGSSVFGTLTVTGGAPGSGTVSGAGSGNEGSSPIPDFYGSNSGWTAAQYVGIGVNSTLANTGHGGAATSSGKSGYCRVMWWE